jgi:hypothetical protein
MTSLLISRKVLRATWPLVMESLVESWRAWQAVMSGVYNGDPGFGFNSARYCVCQLYSECCGGYVLLDFIGLEHMV